MLLLVSFSLVVLLYIMYNKHNKKRDTIYKGCFPYAYKADEIINDSELKGGD